MPTTKRLLTDETGQSLVTAINNIVAAVKPNATEIQMSSSDTTTVATAITNINDKIGTVPSGQTVEGQITTLNSNFRKILWGTYTPSEAIQVGSNNYNIPYGGTYDDVVSIVAVIKGFVNPGTEMVGPVITSINQQSFGCRVRNVYTEPINAEICWIAIRA